MESDIFFSLYLWTLTRTLKFDEKDIRFWTCDKKVQFTKTFIVTRNKKPENATGWPLLIRNKWTITLAFQPPRQWVVSKLWQFSCPDILCLIFFIFHYSLFSCQVWTIASFSEHHLWIYPTISNNNLLWKKVSTERFATLFPPLITIGHNPSTCQNLAVLWRKTQIFQLTRAHFASQFREICRVCHHRPPP